MLNLSDKELDHFSKEAAQEYEPGEVLGERSWERLQVRLDRDLGRVRLNPLRHIRRFPFYYAPAMLVLLGVSYYLMRRSGSPPSAMVKAPAAVVQKPSSSQSPVYTEKSTLSSSAATPTLPAEKAGGVRVGGDEGAAGGANAAGSSGATNATGTNAARSAGTTNAVGARDAGSAANAGRSNNANTAGNAGGNAAGDAGVAGSVGANRNARSGGHAGAAHGAAHGAAAGAGALADGTSGAAGGVGAVAGGTTGTSGVPGATAGGAAPNKELGRVALQGLRSTKKAAHVSDSALRAFTLKSTAPQLIRKGGAHINRSLEFGVLVAPDFANVNSLAGDRPGSSIGLTVDYQFANHFYIGSGLLLDRKIFAARGQDFHAPQGFYQANGIQGNVDLIKGSFEMLEIPLNLRYDFSVSGSTLFFVSSGLSSYLLTSQNNNYYYRTLTFRDQCVPVSSPDKSYLFSALNLSVGVETGLSNSLSLLIAPYMKVPVRGIGVGQVQMSTVGINFALKFAPVISRKRY